MIQNFLFHHVLGEVKIWASVSSRTSGRSMFYKHLLLKFKMVHFIEFFKFLVKNLWCAESQKPLGGFSQNLRSRYI